MEGKVQSLQAELDSWERWWRSWMAPGTWLCGNLVNGYPTGENLDADVCENVSGNDIENENWGEDNKENGNEKNVSESGNLNDGENESGSVDKKENVNESANGNVPPEGFDDFGAGAPVSVEDLEMVDTTACLRELRLVVQRCSSLQELQVTVKEFVAVAERPGLDVGLRAIVEDALGALRRCDTMEMVHGLVELLSRFEEKWRLQHCASVDSAPALSLFEKNCRLVEYASQVDNSEVAGENDQGEARRSHLGEAKLAGITKRGMAQPRAKHRKKKG